MRERGAVEAILVVLLLLGLALHLALRPDYNLRNYEFMPNMVEAPGYDAHDENPNFADGATLRTPPVGTVARGFEPLRVDGVPLRTDAEWADLSPQEQARWDRLKPAWDFETLEPEAQKAILARGAAVFTNVCAVCHGPGGTGGSLVVPRGVPLPPSLLDEKVRPLSDGHMFHVITLGKGAITPGKGNMPSHGGQVAREDRWRVIRHVRKLQEASQ